MPLSTYRWQHIFLSCSCVTEDTSREYDGAGVNGRKKGILAVFLENDRICFKSFFHCVSPFLEDRFKTKSRVNSIQGRSIKDCNKSRRRETVVACRNLQCGLASEVEPHSVRCQDSHVCKHFHSRLHINNWPATAVITREAQTEGYGALASALAIHEPYPIRNNLQPGREEYLHLYSKRIKSVLKN